MTILAFLQNAWFRPGGKNERLILRAIADQALSERLIEKSPAGKRLKRILGLETFDRIRWAYASLQVGTCPGFQPKMSLEHMRGMITEVNPHLVLVFGEDVKGVAPTVWSGPMLYCKDPNGRKADDADLQAFAEHLHQKIAKMTSARFVQFRKGGW